VENRNKEISSGKQKQGPLDCSQFSRKKGASNETYANFVVQMLALDEIQCSWGLVQTKEHQEFLGVWRGSQMTQLQQRNEGEVIKKLYIATGAAEGFAR
jgi:hypothetical protein